MQAMMSWSVLSFDSICKAELMIFSSSVETSRGSLARSIKPAWRSISSFSVGLLHR